jgi:hypothetical protein
MNAEHQTGLREAVFRKTAKDPAWMGYWLRNHQVHEKMDEARLADRLALTMEKYTLLCLCRTPRPDYLRHDIQAICRRTGIKEIDLLRLLRQEQNLEKLCQAGSSESGGWLMAASDRPGGADEPSRPAEEPDDQP